MHHNWVCCDPQAAGHEPDLVLVDGFGACHPRGCGSACHFGLAANCRAIGVGKSLNDVPVLRDKDVKVDSCAGCILLQCCLLLKSVVLAQRNRIAKVSSAAPIFLP